MTTPRIRASLVCQAEGKLLVVRLRDPVSGDEGPFPPGGAVEPDETPAVAAARETLEEAGVVALAEPGITVVSRYPFRWAATDYDVTTHYFGARLERVSPLQPVDDASYNLGAAWLPIEEALDAMSRHGPISRAVREVLRRSNHALWSRHPNVAGPASMLLQIHDQFRHASDLMRNLVRREPIDRGRLRHQFAPLARTLHHHHHAEELMLFPLVHRRTGAEPAQLVDDHGMLATAIAKVERSLSTGIDDDDARAAIDAFNDVLVRHLDREEQLTVPVLLEMSPAEAWALVH